MIKRVAIEDFGPIKKLDVSDFGSINLLIGPNRSGKTVFLKSLYSAQKTLELFGRGKNIKKINDLLFDKLYWTFQVDKVGDIVRKGAGLTLRFEMEDENGGSFDYSFTSKTERQIVNVHSTFPKLESDSIFIPAKEVLTFRNNIIRSRENEEFGFDDTYYDLAKALNPTRRGNNYRVFAKSRKELEQLIAGKLEFDHESNKWVFIQGKNSFDINLTSEGTKKIAILDTLLGNHFLTPKSILFIDEPEAGLHPEMLVVFLDILAALANSGLQLFISSHSYFVVKKLYILAQKNELSIPVISFDENLGIQYGNLRDGIPSNPIIQESINLYKEEMSL